jgi:isoleucyl-tRNA synthetase
MSNADGFSGSESVSGSESELGSDRFTEVAETYNADVADAIENRVSEYWEDVDAYEQTKQHREGNERFFFVDGPPYTSGAAHMGTTWNKSLKDAYIRYLRMRGYDVTDRPGYDMHGLPIETQVEERLGFENKKDIESFGMENFIEECKSYADEQLDGLQADFKSFGVWMDWDNPYRTVTPEYMEAAWWGFKQTHERGLVERGKRSVTQCPRCETAIAKNEVEYHEIESPSIYVKLSLSKRDGSLVIWTTTPWTLPANAFVAVDEDSDYVAVDAEKDGETERLYLAAEMVEDVLSRGRYESYEIVEELRGAEMIGWEYDHPLTEKVSEYPDGDGDGQVYHADYVEMDRTGLVHSAPGHGQEDFERGSELGLDIFSPVGPDGVYTEEVGKYEGQFVRDANSEIIADLDEKGLLLASSTTRHDYGQCWRCDTDIVFLATDQWFVTVTDVKDEMLSNIEESTWHPQEARDNRFRNFIEGSPDWNVSRQRYWGIPIPIWTPAGDEWDGDMDSVIVVGTREELAEKADQDIDPEEVDLHRPTVDDLTITEDGTTYTRVPDVFDVWLDSSVASWGTLDYPEREDEFEELWPADLIMEAHDQTRGWFWSQLGMGTAALDQIPYDEVLMHGWALAPDGRKMSKSIGNVVTPSEALERYGADPMRLFLLSVNPQGEDMRFSWDEMETMRSDLDTLWNVFRFPLPYMRLDGFDPDTVSLEACDLELVDEWILSRLQSTKQEMTEHWENYRQDKALDALLDFVVDDVSRFYIQVVRSRIWSTEQSASKTAAYTTLCHVLLETVQLLAPYAPYITDDIYTTLTEEGFDTVHMCDWPTPEETYHDSDLEAGVKFVRGAEEAGLHARQQEERKLRWPVKKIVVAANDEESAREIDEYRELLKDRLNSRRVEVIAPNEQWGQLRYSARANLDVLGPTFGARADDVTQALNEARIHEPTLDSLEAAVNEALDGPAVDLTEEMVEFEAETPDEVAGTVFSVDSEDRGVVYVDTSLNDDIEAEGYARDAIRKVQVMRNELDLGYRQEIRLELDIDDQRVTDLVREHEELIANEVQASSIGTVRDGYRETEEIEEVTMSFTVEPLAMSEA